MRWLTKLVVLGLAALSAIGMRPASAREAQVPGLRHEVRIEDLPAPYATASVGNSPDVISRPAGARPVAPPGFTVTLFAHDLPDARNLLVLPDGDVLLAASAAGKILRLRDQDGDGVAQVETFVGGFARPYGLAARAGVIYVGDLDGIWMLKEQGGAGQAPVRLTPKGAFGGTQGHRTRNVIVSPDGTSLFVAIGSRSNVAEDDLPRATIQRFSIDGTHQETFARGLRNPVGLAIYPGTEDLYTVVNERDGLGDGLVPDYLTRVSEGQNYGWPYAYLGPHPDPDFGAKRPDLVAATATPDLLFEAHSAPLGLAFYQGTQFPERYRGGAFVALHGSWNRAAPTGYKVVYVPFADGRPKGGYEDFLVGFWAGGERIAKVWGRPAGVAVAKDGSLLVADDEGGAVWRVAFTKN